jgi:hypothetical protein
MGILEGQAKPIAEPFTVQLPDGTIIGGADTAADAMVLAASAAQMIGMATGSGVQQPQITVVDGSNLNVVGWIGIGAYP